MVLQSATSSLKVIMFRCWKCFKGGSAETLLWRKRSVVLQNCYTTRNDHKKLLLNIHQAALKCVHCETIGQSLTTGQLHSRRIEDKLWADQTEDFWRWSVMHCKCKSNYIVNPHKKTTRIGDNGDKRRMTRAKQGDQISLWTLETHQHQM